MFDFDLPSIAQLDYTVDSKMLKRLNQKQKAAVFLLSINNNYIDIKDDQTDDDGYQRPNPPSTFEHYLTSP